MRSRLQQTVDPNEANEDDTKHGRSSSRIDGDNGALTKRTETQEKAVLGPWGDEFVGLVDMGR